MEQLYKIESCGKYGMFEMEIKVGATKLPFLNRASITIPVNEAADKIKATIMAAIIAESPEAQEQARKEKEGILGLFDEKIFVKEIPNGYCPDYCCKHLPWFEITTSVGVFKVGWRKRVLSIDWSGTFGTRTAQELFPNEDTTKETFGIHAWGHANARRYIKAIITSQPLP